MRVDPAENLAALLEAGIAQPAAGRLAKLEHITPEYVRAHVEQIRLEGKHLGAAIYRMERGWRAPPPKSAREEETSEKIRRFLEWRGDDPGPRVNRPNRQSQTDRS